MLTSGTMVLVRENGSRKAVQDLMISDLVYDPWAGQYVEIVDILSRELDLAAHAFAGGHPLAPVKIAKGTVTSTRPTEDVYVSPAQPILRIDRSDSSHPPALRKVCSRNLAPALDTTSCAPCPPRITYHALFTEREQTIDVSGVLMSTYSASVFPDEEQRQSTMRFTRAVMA